MVGVLMDSIFRVFAILFLYELCFSEQVNMPRQHKEGAEICRRGK